VRHQRRDRARRKGRRQGSTLMFPCAALRNQQAFLLRRQFRGDRATVRTEDRGVAAARAVKSGGMVLSPALRADAATAALEPLGLTFKSTNRLPPTRLPELSALLDGGQLRVPPITSFPLEQTGLALEEIAGGHVRGKLVIVVR